MEIPHVYPAVCKEMEMCPVLMMSGCILVQNYTGGCCILRSVSVYFERVEDNLYETADERMTCFFNGITAQLCESHALDTVVHFQGLEQTSYIHEQDRHLANFADDVETQEDIIHTNGNASSMTLCSRYG